MNYFRTAEEAAERLGLCLLHRADADSRSLVRRDRLAAYATDPVQSAQAWARVEEQLRREGVTAGTLWLAGPFGGMGQLPWAVGFAERLARSGDQVLLAGPELASLLPAHPGARSSHVPQVTLDRLSGLIPAGSVAVTTDLEGVRIVAPHRPPMPRAGPPQESGRTLLVWVQSLPEELGTRLPWPDAFDAVVLVASFRDHTPFELEACVRQLRTAGHPLVGLLAIGPPDSEALPPSPSSQRDSVRPSSIWDDSLPRQERQLPQGEGRRSESGGLEPGRPAGSSPGETASPLPNRPRGAGPEQGSSFPVPPGESPGGRATPPASSDLVTETSWAHLAGSAPGPVRPGPDAKRLLDRLSSPERGARTSEGDPSRKRPSSHLPPASSVKITLSEADASPSAPPSHREDPPVSGAQPMVGTRSGKASTPDRDTIPPGVPAAPEPEVPAAPDPEESVVPSPTAPVGPAPASDTEPVSAERSSSPPPVGVSEFLSGSADAAPEGSGQRPDGPDRPDPILPRSQVEGARPAQVPDAAPATPEARTVPLIGLWEKKHRRGGSAKRVLRTVATIFLVLLSAGAAYWFGTGHSVEELRSLVLGSSASESGTSSTTTPNVGGAETVTGAENGSATPAGPGGVASVAGAGASGERPAGTDAAGAQASDGDPPDGAPGGQESVSEGPAAAEVTEEPVAEEGEAGEVEDPEAGREAEGGDDRGDDRGVDGGGAGERARDGEQTEQSAAGGPEARGEEQPDSGTNHVAGTATRLVRPSATEYRERTEDRSIEQGEELRTGSDDRVPDSGPRTAGDARVDLTTAGALTPNPTGEVEDRPSAGRNRDVAELLIGEMDGESLPLEHPLDAVGRISDGGPALDSIGVVEEAERDTEASTDAGNDPQTEADPPDPDTGWVVHLASFKKAEEARVGIARLQQRGVEARAVYVEVPERGPWYRVVAGRFTSFVEARRRALQLSRQLGLDAVHVIGRGGLDAPIPIPLPKEIEESEGTSPEGGSGQESPAKPDRDLDARTNG